MPSAAESPKQQIDRFIASPTNQDGLGGDVIQRCQPLDERTRLGLGISIQPCQGFIGK
jgi:hypothetical protein